MPGKGGLILLLLLCVIPAAGADPLMVMTGDVTAAPGSTVTMPVTVTGAQDLGSMDIVIAYDPSVISVASVDQGSLDKGLFNANTDRPDIITVSIVDPAGISGNGTVANLKFTVHGAAGTSSRITITNILAYDIRTHHTIQADTTGGSVTVRKSGWSLPGFGLWAAAMALGLMGIMRKYRGR